MLGTGLLVTVPLGGVPVVVDDAGSVGELELSSKFAESDSGLLPSVRNAERAPQPSSIMVSNSGTMVRRVHTASIAVFHNTPAAWRALSLFSPGFGCVWSRCRRSGFYRDAFERRHQFAHGARLA